MNTDRLVYVKVNRKVADFIGRTKWHPQMPDGNYLLFITELKRIDPCVLAHREQTAAAIGAVLLTDPQAAEEQRGISCRPLPEATDPRFITDPAEAADRPDNSDGPESSDNTENSEPQEENQPDNSDSSDGSESSDTSDNPKELES